MKNLTQDHLKSILDYDQDSGDFTWKIRPSSHFKNDNGLRLYKSRYEEKKAGHIDSQGYKVININGKNFKAHRLAFLFMTGRMPFQQIDHINGIRNDNRWINLREATKAENLQNQKKAQSDNKSTGLLGASFNKRKKYFQSRINVAGKQIYIGGFKTAQEAHEAYLQAKRKFHKTNTL
jgi:HNH endonuclease